MLAAAETDQLFDNNKTNLRLTTFVWEEGAQAGTQNGDLFIIMSDRNYRTPLYFENGDYTASGNEALEFRIYTNANTNESTRSGYSHAVFNIYADKTPEADAPADDKTEVPEPTAIAYTALGLASLAGMRRKIKK